MREIDLDAQVVELLQKVNDLSATLERQNDIQTLLCLVRTDHDLFKLLLMVDADTETDINDIKKNLGNMSLYQIVCSGVVYKRECVLSDCKQGRILI